MNIGLVTAPDVSWKVIRQRWIELFDAAGVDYVRHDVEVQALPGPAIPHPFTRVLLQTRKAVLRALDDGANTILVITTSHCALLPKSVAGRVYAYGDCTPSQFRELGYVPPRGWRRHPLQGLMSRRIGRFMNAGATALCLTDAFRQRAMTEWGLPPERAHLLPPPLDTETFAPRAASAEASKESTARPLRGLFVGAEFHRKGGDIVESVIDDPRAGSWHWDVVTPHTIAPRPNLTWHPWVEIDQLVSLYQRADVFVLPTRADTAPQTCGEAGACGTPSIATDVGAMREIIIDGVTGTLVPEPSPGLILEALLAYEKSPEMRARHGRAARAHLEPRLNADAHLERLLGIVA